MIVKVSPDIAVVTFCVPAILTVSPSPINVLDESSPATLIPVEVPVALIVIASLPAFVVILTFVPATKVNVSVAVSAATEV